MITGAQLRAARGLLDWTRSDLAKEANVSPETIKNIEHGTFRPQESTAEAIVRAFALHGIEFTANEGVCRSIETVINYEGREDFKRYADDVYAAILSSKDRTICIYGNDDKEFVDALGNYAELHLQRMAKLDGLQFKALMTEGKDIFVAKYIEYRRIPNVGLAIPFSVYGNRFDFILYGEGAHYPKVVAIKSQAVADAYRAQFEALWKQSSAIK